MKLQTTIFHLSVFAAASSKTIYNRKIPQNFQNMVEKCFKERDNQQLTDKQEFIDAMKSCLEKTLFSDDFTEHRELIRRKRGLFSKNENEKGTENEKGKRAKLKGSNLQYSVTPIFLTSSMVPKRSWGFAFPEQYHHQKKRTFWGFDNELDHHENAKRTVVAPINGGWPVGYLDNMMINAGNDFINEVDTDCADQNTDTMFKENKSEDRDFWGGKKKRGIWSMINPDYDQSFKSMVDKVAHYDEKRGGIPGISQNDNGLQVMMMIPNLGLKNELEKFQTRITPANINRIKSGQFVVRAPILAPIRDPILNKRTVPFFMTKIRQQGNWGTPVMIKNGAMKRSEDNVFGSSALNNLSDSEEKMALVLISSDLLERDQANLGWY